MTCDKIKKELGWRRKYAFDVGLDRTIAWYLGNRKWVENIQNGSYKNWINRKYSSR